MSDRADCARQAAEAGAAVAMETFRQGIAVETKADKTDVVTRADRDAQERVLETIREVYPGEPVVGEEDENPGSVPESGPAWVVDPIDGTGNYVRGIRDWTTSVAATVDGEPVAGATVCPALEDSYVLAGDAARLNGEAVAVGDRTDPETFAVVPTLWWGFDRREEYAAACRAILERFGDLRRFGSTQFELALCASGAVDAVVTNREAYPWDSVLGVGLVRAAGGVVTDIDGEPWRHDSRGLVASSGRAHDLVLEAARAAEREADR